MTQRPTRTTTPRSGDTVTAQGFDDPGQVDFIEDDAGEPMYSVQLPSGRLPFRGDQLTVCNEPNYALLMGYSHVVMCCRYGDIDVILAPSYDQALDYVRTRAAANDWSSFCDDPVDLSTATLDQLNALYRGDDAADENWVRIDHVAQLGALPLYLEAPLNPPLIPIPANINDPSAPRALYDALLPCPTCDAGRREPYSGMWKDEHGWHAAAHCWTCNNARAITLAAIAALLEEQRHIVVERDMETERANRAEAFWYEILAALTAAGMAMNQATESSGVYVHTPVGRTDAFPTYGEALKAGLQALIDRAVSTSQTGLKFPTQLAGKATKVMLFMCETCHTCTARWQYTFKIAEEDATRELRADGWSKTKDGWRCPSCVQRQKARLPYPQTIVHEGNYA